MGVTHNENLRVKFSFKTPNWFSSKYDALDWTRKLLSHGSCLFVGMSRNKSKLMSSLVYKSILLLSSKSCKPFTLLGNPNS